MCVRMCPLSLAEAKSALKAREETGRARVGACKSFPASADAYPGRTVIAYVPAEDGRLAATELIWGFRVEGRKQLVYNTRLETALSHIANGAGMWREAILNGRCLVPVRAFYEGRVPKRVEDSEASKSSRKQYRFRLRGSGAFLLAGVFQDGRLSIVTTQPNQLVAGYHKRMPLVLGPGESRVWLGPDFANLADRDGIGLTVEAEA